MAISNPVDIGSVATVANSGTQAFNTTVIIPAGAKIQVEVGWFDATATLSNVGGGGLTWTIDHQGKNGSVGFAIVSADAPAGLASGTTLTATYSSGTADRFMGGEYETGVQTGAGAAYGVVSQNQSVAAWSSTTTTVTNGDILIGGGHTSQASGSPTSTAGGGNTEIHDITCADGDSLTSVYQLGTGSAIAASGTWTGAGWTDRSAAVAYKAAPDTGSPTLQPLLPTLRRFSKLGSVFLGFPPAVLPTATSVTYTDSPTGTLTFTGSSTETHSHSSSPSGTLTLSGTRVEANLRSDSPAGTITLSGTRTESNVHAPAVSGSLAFSGSQAQSQSHSSSPSGTITFSGSQTQSQAHTVAVTGTITFGGTVVENFQPPGVPSGGNYRSQADEVRLLLFF